MSTDTEHLGQTEQVTESDNGLLVVSSSRYLGRHSAEAFPRVLGLQFQAQVLPRLQPFAWNLEVRETPPCKVKGAICSLITLEATQKQLRSFFFSDFPACGFLDLQDLTARCEKHWLGHDQGLPFEALISGVIGLASVLDNAINVQQEADIIQHAENILNDPVILSEPHVEVLAAIVLRVLYLRATTTPHVTWLLSCTAMHMAESLGLHKDYESNVGKHHNTANQWDNDAISCMFWIICAGNRLVSHELGRSPVVLHGVTQKFPFSPSDTDGAAILCRLGCLLPVIDAADGDQERSKQSLDIIAKAAGGHPFIKLIAADVCFCLYRRIHVGSHGITKEQSQQVVLIGRAAVKAANQLLHKGRPWWNMLGTLFQFCCVLISMDSLDSLADLRYAMKTINLIQDRYPGEKKAQALSTLKALIMASKQRKQTQIAYLSAVDEPEEACVNIHDDFSQSPTDLTFPELPFDITSWGMEDLDWMAVEAPLGL
ncbi:hypothetical protein N7474_008374 [Penicillium riverlandense]|uniref:uncharacterized protein n=1 Tax=Penicillium riverlandense TaxID=1903569 RepID=UPI002546D4D1|nr:uncharacterized protein N7474_008374 [Penicillium riverlandense]KAJ5812073.1 hypothetical protein N7474_008374 [Penicillium riverlandense]